MVMRGFSEAAIPDAERADLIAYLRYMSHVGKVTTKPLRPSASVEHTASPP